MTRILGLTTALLLSSSAMAADLPVPDLSPRAEVMQSIGVVSVTVNYSSPAKRGRDVWGKLVPYGELWRTGANGATTFETTGDLTVGGEEVPAGKYALFTIPGEEEWTVILNQNPNQGGTGRYDKGLDQARFTVKPGKGAERENLTFLFDDISDGGASLQLVWDGVKVALPIEVKTKAMVVKSIEAYTGSASGDLARAARYLASTKDYDKALEVIDVSLGIERTWFNVWLKAEFLHEKGEHKEAKKLATRALELGNAAEGFFYKERVEKAVAEWPKK